MERERGQASSGPDIHTVAAAREHHTDRGGGGTSSRRKGRARMLRQWCDRSLMPSMWLPARAPVLPCSDRQQKSLTDPASRSNPPRPHVPGAQAIDLAHPPPLTTAPSPRSYLLYPHHPPVQGCTRHPCQGWRNQRQKRLPQVPVPPEAAAQPLGSDGRPWPIGDRGDERAKGTHRRRGGWRREGGGVARWTPAGGGGGSGS